MTRDVVRFVAWLAMGAGLSLSMLCGPATAGARRRHADEAVEAEAEGQWIVLMSQAEYDRREEEERQRVAAEGARAAARPVAPVYAYAVPEPRRNANRGRRRRGPPLYRQERTAGETYRQKYASWSCSAASLTIAVSQLDRGPANAVTEERVIKELGSNISKKDGLTGQGMQALADVARREFELGARRIESTADVQSEVQAGHLVVLDVKRPISGRGHYVVVAGPGRRAGTLHIKDPARDGGDFEWDHKTLQAAMRAGGVAIWK